MSVAVIAVRQRRQAADRSRWRRRGRRLARRGLCRLSCRPRPAAAPRSTTTPASASDEAGVERAGLRRRAHGMAMAAVRDAPARASATARTCMRAASSAAIMRWQPHAACVPGMSCQEAAELPEDGARGRTPSRRRWARTRHIVRRHRLCRFFQLAAGAQDRRPDRRNRQPCRRRIPVVATAAWLRPRLAFFNDAGPGADQRRRAGARRARKRPASPASPSPPFRRASATAAPRCRTERISAVNDARIPAGRACRRGAALALARALAEKAQA